MKIAEIVKVLEAYAPPACQESYDNAGLLTGAANWECKGVLCTLDATEAIIDEAIETGCNLVVAHHPIIFSGLKKINGKNYVERTIIKAIKNDIAIFAIHTNLDNVILGVGGKMADKLGLINRKVLQPKPNTLMKLFVFVPASHAENVRNAIFMAGGGNIGNYSECSFNTLGTGTFNPGENSKPFAGVKGERERADEEKIEVIFPSFLQHIILDAMKKAHPYEEVAYDLVALQNEYQDLGSGLIGELPNVMDELEFLHFLKNTFLLEAVRHTPLLNKKIKKVALCGGAGSFLIKNALASGADVYISADIKYHEFFDAEDRMVITDIGHYESEQFTVDLLFDVLHSKFPTFALLKSKIRTNPVHYFI